MGIRLKTSFWTLSLIFLNLLRASFGAPNGLAASGDPLFYLGSHRLEIPEGIPSMAREVFQEQSIWFFDRKTAWDQLVSEHADAAQARNLLGKALPFEKLPPGIQARLRALYIPEDLRDRVFVVADQAEVRKIPKSLVGAVYDIQIWQKVSASRPVMKFLNENDLRTRLAHDGVPPGNIESLVRKSARGAAMTFLPLDAETRQLLPEPIVRQLMDPHFYAQSDSILGYKAFLEVNESTIPGIVRKFSSPATATSMTEALHRRLAGTKQQPLYIPAEEVLSPFIQERLWTFNALPGGNCHHAGLCTARNITPADGARFVSPGELVEKLRTEFRAIPPSEPMRAGDLLIYWERQADGTMQPAHSANYVGEGRIGPQGQRVSLVFTKNGWNVAHPYIFSDMENVDRVYANTEVMTVFRHAEGAASPDGAAPLKIIPYRKRIQPHQGPGSECSTLFAYLGWSPQADVR